MTDAAAPREGGSPLQATLRMPFRRSGPGLHTGRRASVTVSPAPAGTGILFRRTLKDGSRVEVPALWRHRVSQPLCTALRTPEGPLLRTVEHLLAALSALAVDNALVEIDAEELPIFDGSATPWCEAILEAGRAEQEAPRRAIRVLREVAFEDGRRSLRVAPADSLVVAGRLSLAHFGEMAWEGAVTPESFVAELAPSRSFGRLKWALPARIYGHVTRKPLLRGANFRTTAAIVGGRIVGGMRLPDEPVRHRLMDLVGDLALAGHPILGRFVGAHIGHEVNHALLAKLMAQTDSWELV